MEAMTGGVGGGEQRLPTQMNKLQMADRARLAGVIIDLAVLQASNYLMLQNTAESFNGRFNTFSRNLIRYKLLLLLVSSVVCLLTKLRQVPHYLPEARSFGR